MDRDNRSAIRTPHQSNTIISDDHNINLLKIHCGPVNYLLLRHVHILLSSIRINNH